MLLKLDHVTKHYLLGDTTITALDHVSLTVNEGEFVAVMGPSGSGKSTFLQVASMLAEPTSGKIFLKDKDVTEYNEVERAHLRNREIGFVFQQFNLLPRTSTLDNAMLPLIYSKERIGGDERNRRAVEILDKVGLGDRLSNTPAQLSGGQQQRVAIARALINNPSILFADEPTGNLDSHNGREIMQLFTNLHKEGKTIIMVTHEDHIAAYAHRVIVFKDGKVTSDTGHDKKHLKSTTRKRKK